MSASQASGGMPALTQARALTPPLLRSKLGALSLKVHTCLLLTALQASPQSCGCMSQPLSNSPHLKASSSKMQASVGSTSRSASCKQYNIRLVTAI